MRPMQLLQHAQFHGANRLGDKWARWFWVPSLLILLGSAISLVMLTVARFEDNPTYIAQIETTYISRRFPSVIVCPAISFMEDRMARFLEKLRYPFGMNASYTREILPQLGAFYSPDVPYNVPDLVKVENLLDYNGIDVETAGKLLTASCEETIIKCRWGKVYMNCTELFRMELTGDGFCCVFNGRSLRREMEEKYMDIHKSEPDNHWYTQRFGFTSGLILAIDQSQKPLNVDLSYKWLALETSQHFCDTTANGTALNPGAEQWFVYYTRSFQITMAARALSANLRKCHLKNHKLQYFPVYNKRYCLLEYEIGKSLERCNCVRTVHPRPPGTSRCRAQTLLCSKQTMVAYDDAKSHCPGTCEVDTVITKASSMQLDSTIQPIDTFYHDLNFSRVTVVRVFIQQRKQTTKERWSTYGYLDLFSQLGGMFNVFFGCSVLTLLALLHLGYRVLETKSERLRKLRNLLENYRR